MDYDDTNWIGPVIIMLTLDFDTSCVEAMDCVCRRMRKLILHLIDHTVI